MQQCALVRPRTGAGRHAVHGKQAHVVGMHASMQARQLQHTCCPNAWTLLLHANQAGSPGTTSVFLWLAACSCSMCRCSPRVVSRMLGNHAHCHIVWPDRLRPGTSQQLLLARQYARRQRASAPLDQLRLTAASAAHAGQSAHQGSLLPALQQALPKGRCGRLVPVQRSIQRSSLGVQLRGRLLQLMVEGPVGGSCLAWTDAGHLPALSIGGPSLCRGA